MLVRPGTVFVAPLSGQANSVTFVTLDCGCKRVLILDGGFTVYQPGVVYLMNWNPEEWLERGWTAVEG